MIWQKWCIRGLVLAVLGALACAVTLYALWTSPQAIRQLVQEKLGVRFVGVGVQVGSARLRLLGGILVRELRLARSDSLDQRDFLFVPDAVIYHDKEQMLDGKVAIRRVELSRPQIRLVRERDGRLNVSGILGPTDLNERMPTMTLRQGTLIFEDRSCPLAPLLEVRELQLTMINDPLPYLQLEGSGQSDVLGPIRFRVRVSRADFTASLELELSSIPVGPELMQRLAGLSPEIGQHLARVSGIGKIQATVEVPGQPDQPVTYEAALTLAEGRCTHPLLPAPVDHFELTARLVNGHIPEAHLKATSGVTRLEARVADVRLPHQRLCFDELEKQIGALDLTVKHLQVDDALLARLPEDLHFIKEDFSPAGPLSVQYRYRRQEQGRLVKEWTLQPQGMTGCYLDFPLPLREVRGTIWLDTSRVPRRNIRIDLAGLGGDRPATLKGTIQGEKKTSEIVLDITGKDILLDDRILRALPPRARKVVHQFLPPLSRKHGLAAHPMGQADVQAQIRRAQGQTRIEKYFTIVFRKTSVYYDQFPLVWDDVSGTLILYPDHWEAHGFHGRHSGGEMFVEGRSHPLPGKEVLSSPEGELTPPERVHIKIRGRDLPLNQEFERALVPLSGNERQDLQAAWKRLRLTGRLSFAAEVIDHPGQPQDIDVSVNVQGCSMKPSFFEYALEQLSGSVRYARGRLYLKDMRAQHGAATFGLSAGLIQLGSEGGFTAWLQGLTGQNVPADNDLLQAVPESLKRVLEAVRLKTPMNMAASLTVVSPAGPSRPLEVWWEGVLGLQKASFRAGVEVTDATGKVFCKGYHDGHRLRGMNGRLDLERAQVLGQPVTRLHARMDIEPSSPEVLRIRDLKGELFGGTVAGQAKIETFPFLKYDVLLEALGVQLELLGRHNLGESNSNAQLQGASWASLHLTGEGSDLLNLKGNGRIDVPKGKMGELPVLLDLVKAFGLRVPDRTAFRQAGMVFAIEGPQIHVKSLDLFGDAISLRGQGSVDLDGSNINLAFRATPGYFDIPEIFSGQILKIKMRGKLGKGGQIKFDKELMPGVVEPIRRLIGGG